MSSEALIDAVREYAARVAKEGGSGTAAVITSAGSLVRDIELLEQQKRRTAAEQR